MQNTPQNITNSAVNEFHGNVNNKRRLWADTFKMKYLLMTVLQHIAISLLAFERIVKYSFVKGAQLTGVHIVSVEYDQLSYFRDTNQWNIDVKCSCNTYITRSWCDTFVNSSVYGNVYMIEVYSNNTIVSHILWTFFYN